MYIVNLDSSVDEKDYYVCNGLIASHLIYVEDIPVFGRSGAERFCFSRTEKLTTALSRLPFWLLFSNERMNARREVTQNEQ